MMDHAFRVLTLNIHKGFAVGPRRLVLNSIRELLRDSQANLVFLQEVVGVNRKHERKQPRWPDDSQLEYLADTVWTHHAYGKNAIYQHGHHGNAILSEHPFTWWNNIDVSLLTFSQRGFIHGVIDPGVHVICTHFGLFERERRQQVMRLISHIQNDIPEEAPLVIAGDFNDWRRQSHRTLKDSLGMQEAHELLHGHCADTYPAFFPILPMDRIYLRGFRVKSCDSLAGDHWRNFSDHQALVADLELTTSGSDQG